VKRFSVFIGQSLCGPGVQSWLDVGDAVTVDGRQMVRLPGGTIVTADGWHDTLQAAQAAAADRLEEIAGRVADQARRMREVARG
jgi:hypothetical protein